MITTILVYLPAMPRLLVNQAPAVQLEIRPDGAIGQQLLLAFSEDDEEALGTVALLEAALDNAASAIRLRQQRREQASGEGAGASVEAYRG